MFGRRKKDPDGINARIGIWGATQAGKSSYLAALSLASLFEANKGINIQPADRIRDKSSERWHALQGPFHQYSMPPATMVTQPIALTVQENGRDSTILIQDPRGGDFADSKGMDHDFWQELALADGIIYLYDPLRDIKARSASAQRATQHADGGAGGGAGSPWIDTSAFGRATGSVDENNYAYLYQGLDLLHQICRENRTLQNGRLPQHLAICLTKLDHDDVFSRLYQSGLLTPPPDEDGTYSKPPTVVGKKNNLAAFTQFAPEILWRRLTQSFDPGRIEYFTISSAGYYAENQRLRVGDSSNVNADGRSLRSDVRPISVVDPFAWLVRSM